MAVTRRHTANCVFIILFLFFTGYIRTLYAEDYIRTNGYVHGLGNGVNIYTGVFALNKDINLNTALYIKYSQDRITYDYEGADAEDDESGEDEDEDDSEEREDSPRPNTAQFVDVMSAASAIATGSSLQSSIIEDTRNEITVGISQKMSRTSMVQVYYDYSREDDYLSLTPSVSLVNEFFQKNTTLTLGYSKNIDIVSGYYIDKKEK